MFYHVEDIFVSNMCTDLDSNPTEYILRKIMMIYKGNNSMKMDRISGVSNLYSFNQIFVEIRTEMHSFSSYSPCYDFNFLVFWCCTSFYLPEIQCILYPYKDTADINFAGLS